MDFVQRSLHMGIRIYTTLQFHVVSHFESEALFERLSFGGDNI